jgi:hypothetical protein
MFASVSATRKEEKRGDFRTDQKVRAMRGRKKKRGWEWRELQGVGLGRTVVSGLIGRLRVIGVPPSFAIFAFLRWSRRSWFFFMRAISSSNLFFSYTNFQQRKKKRAKKEGGLKGGKGEATVNIPLLCSRVAIDVTRRR